MNVYGYTTNLHYTCQHINNITVFIIRGGCWGGDGKNLGVNSSRWG